MNVPRHRKGEPFEFRHLDEGESLTEPGSMHIRRGHYRIISAAAGYRYMEQFGQYRISRPMKSYSLAKMRAVVDQLNKQHEEKGSQ